MIYNGFESKFFSGDVFDNNKIKDMDLERSHKALAYIKSKFHSYVKNFLKDDLEKTTLQSEGYVHSSNGEWKSGYTNIVMPGLSYREYHDWFMRKLASFDEISLQMAHPDHYLNAMCRDKPKTVEIIENLGEDDLPWYLVGEFCTAEGTPLKRDSNYQEEFCLRIHSANNIVIGYAAHEFRNDENGNCNIKLTIILPKAAPEFLVLGHLNHFTIEFRNWYLMACSDKENNL